MAYPKDQLSSGESILLESKPHWIGLKMEILYTVVYLIAFWLVVPVWDTDLGIDGWLGWALFFVWIALAGKGLLEWSSTDFVVTNSRVIFRRGVMTKVGYEIPVDRVQDVGFRQGLLQRMVGAGDLLVQSSASEGQTAIRDITDPLGLKKMITDVRDGRSPTASPAPAAPPPTPAAPAAPPAAPPPPPAPAGSSKSTAEQLEILARLHAGGSLSDAEFQAEKTKLLGL